MYFSPISKHDFSFTYHYLFTYTMLLDILSYNVVGHYKTNEYDSLYSSVSSSRSDLIDEQNCIDFCIYEHCNKANCANHFNRLSLEDIRKSIKFLRKTNQMVRIQI